MINTIKQNLLWTEGRSILPVIIILLVSGIIIHSIFFYSGILLLLFSFYFFRNPRRIASYKDTSLVFSPADGRVVDIRIVTDSSLEGFSKKISIFLSPLDVHVNWIPSTGTIEEITYRPGTFTMAFVPKSSDLNERNDIRIRCFNGKTIIVRQIAGTIARKICCWVKKNKSVQAGEKFGMIRFGSRVDILLPHEVALSCKIGDYVYGGKTILGRWL